jgi:hypothetical protein
MSNEFVIKQGSTWPPIRITVTDADTGELVDLEGCSVKMVIDKNGTIMREDCIIASLGVIHYIPSEDATEDTGGWNFEIEITWPNTHVSTLPVEGFFRLIVTKELD